MKPSPSSLPTLKVLLSTFKWFGIMEATGKAEYKTFAETNYTNVNPYKINWWGPYWIPQQLALLRLTTLPGISSTVVITTV